MREDKDRWKWTWKSRIKCSRNRGTKEERKREWWGGGGKREGEKRRWGRDAGARTTPRSRSQPMEPALRSRVGGSLAAYKRRFCLRSIVIPAQPLNRCNVCSPVHHKLKWCVPSDLRALGCNKKGWGQTLKSSDNTRGRLI